MRNRIIAALSTGVVVIEAEKKSGSLITADMALDLGKDIFALPGRCGDSLSAGCNNLIKQGAFIVSDYSDFDEIYAFSSNINKIFSKKGKFFLETYEKMVYANLSLEPKHINQIANECEMQTSEVMRHIYGLLKKDYVKEVGMNYYIRQD